MRSITMSAAIILGITTALLATPGQLAAQPRTCGDQGLDNRPNGCSVRRGGTWVYQVSKCEVIGKDRVRYTHCSGATRELKGSDLVCAVGSCRGGYARRDARR